MAFNIYNFMSEKDYKEVCKSLKNRETKVIYSDNSMDIEIRKVGKRTLIFVNIYGNKKLNEALNNVCSLIQQQDFFIIITI